MQTFVPFTNHQETAELLDPKRLFKQLVEGKQILLALDDPNYGWQNHPAVMMWRGHEEALVDYLLVLAQEWRYRGTLRETHQPYDESITEWLHANYLCDGGQLPEWWGGPIHFTHQLKLLYKMPEWYEPKLGFIAPRIEPNYFWPVRKKY